MVSVATVVVIDSSRAFGAASDGVPCRVFTVVVVSCVVLLGVP